MKKRTIKNVFGLLAIILFIGFNFNGENAIADEVHCRCGVLRAGCFANGWWGATCTLGEDCSAGNSNCAIEPE